MELTRLDPSLRKNLKDLLEGYLEHCHVSQHLMARIDFPIYFQGFKFGAPVFTHTGSAEPGEDRQVIGLVGRNTPHSQAASEILLQLIEILVQHPQLAGSSVLRILPVVNPVALELGGYAPEIEEWPVLEHLLDVFYQQAPDGILEVGVSTGEFTLEGKVPALLFDALEKVKSDAPRDRLRGSLRLPERISLSPALGDERWVLRLGVPAGWTESGEIHAVARFIERLLRTHSWLRRSQEVRRATNDRA